MCHLSRTVIAATMVLTMVVPSTSYACGDRHSQRHHPTHGKLRSIFVDPVGYSYPAVRSRTRVASYKPLPDIPMRPMDTLVPTPPPQRQKAPVRRPPGKV